MCITRHLLGHRLPCMVQLCELHLEKWQHYCCIMAVSSGSSGSAKRGEHIACLLLRLEKEMATHSSILACTIPGTGERDGLLSVGSHRVGHDWSDLAAAAASPEKAMAPHSSTLAWKIPWMEEPGGLQSMGLRRVGHDWTSSLSLFTFMHWRRKWQPTPVFLPGESQSQGSLVGCCQWGRTESDTTEAT